MATSQELMAQAQALMAQAEVMRKQELASVIDGLKAQIKEYGLTAADLGLGAAVGKKGAGAKGSKLPAKFKGPNGELWSGGPGRRPGWVKDVEAAGGNLDAYRI